MNVDILQYLSLHSLFTIRMQNIMDIHCILILDYQEQQLIELSIDFQWNICHHNFHCLLTLASYDIIPNQV